MTRHETLVRYTGRLAAAMQKSSEHLETISKLGPEFKKSAATVFQAFFVRLDPQGLDFVVKYYEACALGMQWLEVKSKDLLLVLEAAAEASDQAADARGAWTGEEINSAFNQAQLRAFDARRSHLREAEDDEAN